MLVAPGLLRPSVSLRHPAGDEACLCRVSPLAKVTSDELHL